MNCSNARREIKAYIDGELRPWTRLLVARHLASCDDCRREMQEMGRLTTEVRSASASSAPDGLKDKVLAGLTFEPTRQPSSKKPLWRNLGAIAAASLGVVLVATVILPLTQSAKETSRARVERPLGVAKDFDLSIQGKVKGNGAIGRSAPALACRPPAKAAATGAPEARPMASQPAPHASAPQMIIKTADLGIRVRSYARASDMAVSIAKSAGGYVSDTSAVSDRGAPTEGCMTLRVPVAAFERTLSRLARLGTVTSRSISGEDVTGESIDTESRLRNLRAEERQYLEIMNRARRIPDVVTVTNELTRVRGEIEDSQGRLKYLKNSAAMSTINLSLDEKNRVPAQRSAIEKSFGSAVASLARTANGIASMIIWLLVYLPIWAVGAAVVLYLRRRARHTATENQ